ncbi:MAG: PCP reductase family protein [Bacillota bacterium]
MEARARLERVPFLIRKKVKQQIEEYGRQCGRQVVTNQDVTAARQELLAGSGVTVVGQDPQPDTGSRHPLGGETGERAQVLNTAGGSLSAQASGPYRAVGGKGGGGRRSENPLPRD